MNKIALTAAAILLATGTAFAGSNHFDQDNINKQAVAVDHSVTASVSKSTVTVQAPAAQGADRNLFGR